MTNYDFSTLNGVEFEELVNDLLSRELKVRIERFREGKDQGVDGRYFIDEKKEIIIQSKHYLKSGFSAIKSTCTKEEKPKVDKLEPNRYIFACSTELSRHEKNEICEIFKPHLKRNDIYDGTKINDLIKDNKDIEFNHYKLWLSSSNILNSLINSDIDFDCQSEYKSILKLSKKYVKTKLHEKAKGIIEKSKFLLILGEPGVGKTTLARMICNEYIRDGFEFIYVCDDIKNAKRKYNQQKKQIFYLDDFLGSNHLTEFNNNEDRRIDDFIDSVISDENKRVILTSRTVIFNQAQSISEAFSQSNLEPSSITINASDISTLDKAYILYNHLYFAIEPENEYHKHIAEILENDRYFDIINHANYNPRLIELMFGFKTLQQLSPKNYWSYIQSSLDNPSALWEKHVKYQISDEDRVLLWFVSLAKPNGIEREKLRDIYLSFTNNANDIYNFNHTIRCLENALLESTISYNRKEYIKICNNSIRDYILPMLLKNNPEYTTKIIIALKRNFHFGIIPTDLNLDTRNFIRKLIIELSNTEKCIELLSILLSSIRRICFSNTNSSLYFYENEKVITKELNKSKETLIEYIEWYNEKSTITEHLDLYEIILLFKISNSLDSIELVNWGNHIKLILNDDLDHDDLVQLSYLCSLLSEQLDSNHNFHDHENEIDDKLIRESQEYWDTEIEYHLNNNFEEDILVNEYAFLFDEYNSFYDFLEDNSEYEMLTYTENHINDIVTDLQDEYYTDVVLVDNIDIDADEYNEKAIDMLRLAFEESKEKKEKNQLTQKNKTRHPKKKNQKKITTDQEVRDIFK